MMATEGGQSEKHPSQVVRRVSIQHSESIPENNQYYFAGTEVRG